MSKKIIGVTVGTTINPNLLAKKLKPAVEPMEADIPKVFINGTIPTTKDDVYAEMDYISKTDRFKAYLKIKCQGSSSMSYDKKNFTIKLYSDDARDTKLEKTFKDWGHASNKFVLKANYIDHSHARNIVCANLWDEVVFNRADYANLPTEMRNSPRNGAIDGFPVKVYTNGTYQGIYTWNIGKDAWMWGMDEGNPNHVLMCGETNTDGVYAETACNFRALWSGTDGDYWSVEVGKNSDAVKNSLNALISCVKDADDETFKATVGNYLDVQSAIDYWIHQSVICGLDGLAKNMLLATYDGTKWICGAYDLDSTFGLWWNGTSFVSANYRCPKDYQEPYSLLWDRMASLFSEEIKTRYNELRNTVYSYANMVTRFERFTDIIGKDLYTEDLEVYANIPSGDTNNIKQIRNYIRDRLVYCDGQIPYLGLSETYTTLSYIESDGNQYIDTGVSGGENASYELAVQHTSSEYEIQSYDYIFAGARNNTIPFLSITTWDGVHAWAYNDTACEYDASLYLHKGIYAGQLIVKYNCDGTLYGEYNADGFDLITPSKGEATVVAGRGWGDSSWHVFTSAFEKNVISMRLYYLKMYTDGVLVRDFVPAKRDSDSVIGLWDKVTETFFENIGTGAFTGM